MSEVAQTNNNALLNKISKQLIEEKWTRTTIDNYSKQNFIILDKVIEDAKNQNICDELREICIEHLDNSPKSATALYIASILIYEHDIIDDSYIFELIFLFKEHQKWHIVEFLCKKVLHYGESKSALILLSEVYTNTKEKSSLVGIWERLTKVDYENGDAPRKLAQYYEKNDDLEESIHFYKMAMKRFVKGQFNVKLIEEIWNKLLESIPEQLNFFLQAYNEIVKQQVEKANNLLMLLLPYYKNKKNYQQVISILQVIVKYDPKQKTIRTELINTLREVYKSHSQLENYINKSQLESNSDLSFSLSNFKKYIVFDTGSFVYHRSWGIGKVIECNEDSLIIDFERKINHSMSFKIALSSLKVLTEDHIWIRKRKSLDDLKKIIDQENGIEAILKIIFKSYANNATMREIKSEMLDLIPKNSWTKWWNKAKQIMKTSSIFGNSLNKRDLYFLRDKPLTFKEESFSMFNSSNLFDKKLSIFMDYLKHSDDTEDEEFQYMLNFFVEIVNAKNIIDVKTIKSFLVLRKLKRDKPSVVFELKLNSYELLSFQDDLVTVYNDLQDIDYKRDILINIIKKNNTKWYDVFLDFLIKTHVSKAHSIIIENLLEYDKEILKSGLNNILQSYRKNAESYFWLVKILLNDEDLLNLTGNSDTKRLVFNLFYCIDILNRDLSNKKSVTNKNSRKLLPQIMDFLLKDNFFENYLKQLDQSDARKIVAIINSVTILSEKAKSDFLLLLYNNFKDLIKDDNSDDQSEHYQFLVTNSSYKRKQAELQNIVDIEIPNNSKAIGIAKELGDLRENADYIAALEHQKYLQQQASSLSKELSMVRVIQLSDVNNEYIQPGTKAKLQNIETEEIQDYIILGEWESNMEKGIISYKSPFGKALLGYKVKDVINFNYDKIQKNYKILSITIAVQFLT